MSLTEKQNLPEKPKEAPLKWETRQLFAFKAIATAVSKLFLNPFDIILAFCMFIIGITELFGRHVSILFFALTVIFIGIAFFDRYNSILLHKKEEQ